jgi:AcrR family transcriptional regulator
MARKSAEDRRRELLEAALRVIRRQGFAHLTLRDVAAEVGVAHSLVRHYFGTRDQLLAEAFALAAIFDEPSVLDDARATPLEKLLWWTEPMDRDHYLIWIDAWSEAPRSPELKKTLLHFEDFCQQTLAGLLADAAAAGSIEVHDPMAAAQRINAVVDGLAIQHYALGRLSRTDLDAQRATALSNELGLPVGDLVVSGAR